MDRLITLVSVSIRFQVFISEGGREIKGKKKKSEEGEKGKRGGAT